MSPRPRQGRRPRIAVLGEKFFPSRGGTSRVVESTVRQLADRYDFTVYAWPHPEAEGLIPGVQVVQLPRPKVQGVGVWLYYRRCVQHALRQDYDLVHVHKLDAPSGTALKLGEALARGQGGEFDSLYHYDPHGSPGAEGQITFKVRREGEVPGDHEVVFASNSEVISLAHSVSDRRVFADGAIAAARWLVNQGPGRYRMSNLLEE